MPYIVGPSTDVVIRWLLEGITTDVEFVDTWEIGSWKAKVDPSGPFEIQFSDGGQLSLDPEDRFFIRLIDVGRKLSDLDGIRQKSLIASLNAWFSSIPGRVMNRPGQNIHNGSKPIHECVLSRLGFAVPDSITSTNREKLTEFCELGRSIAKTISGVRARARLVAPSDFTSDRQFDGPVHIQRFIDGRDVRVHVVGERVHALEINGMHVDYRHSDTNSSPIRGGKAIHVPEEIERLLVHATSQLSLEIAGWDFKVDNDNTWWCLEVNPMPAFSPYDCPLNRAISTDVISWLTHKQML